MASANQRLRVLYLITDFERGGAERFLIDLTRELETRGDVEFIIGSLYDKDQYEELTQGLPIRQLNYATFSTRATDKCPAYQELLESFKPDVVHTHRFLAEFLSSHYVSNRIAYICHGHDNMVQLAKPSWRSFMTKGRLTNLVERTHLITQKYRKARTWFIANSKHTMDYYKRVLPASMKDDVRLINYGFDYEKFLTGPRTPPREGERLRLLNVGSFQDKKNQIFIVEIAKELVRAEVNFEIHLLGEGKNRVSVGAAVAAAGLDKQIFLHGNVSRVEEWMWNSHLYLHTALYEPFGLVFLEAMAAGLPCVTLDGKGNRDLIEEGRNGYLIGTQNPMLFSEKIVEVSRSPRRYEQMSEYARDYASRYDIGPATESLVGFYRSCVASLREVTGGATSDAGAE